MTQDKLDLNTKNDGAVECLGQTFSSNEARREHFLKLLAVKLKSPEFREIEGFPIGKDEDILELSDPPYYTACPNPWISDFLAACGTPYDPRKPYHREPFATDVSEGKYHPIYKLHPYHTKVPHRAIMRYILHYTQPGDVVFDGFCGTGMTGVAAQLCGDRAELLALGYRVEDDGTILNEEAKPFSKLGVRCAVLNDLSPAATFIASYGNFLEPVAFGTASQRILKEVEEECSWMYSTLSGATDAETRAAAECVRKCKNETEIRALLDDADRLKTQIDCRRSNLQIAKVNFVVWSDVFLCQECGTDIVFWDSAVEYDEGKVRDEFECPKCRAALKKRNLDRKMTRVFDRHLSKTLQQGVQVAVLINARSGSSKIEKSPDAFDAALEERIRAILTDIHPPILKLAEDGFNTSQPIRSHGFTYVHHFYTDRNLAVLVRALRKCKSAIQRALITKVAFRISKRYGLTYQAGRWGAGGGPTTGTLYVPSLVKELNMISMLEAAADTAEARAYCVDAHTIISTQSSSHLSAPDESCDYLFLDPPFGSNIMYSELNCFWEAWLKVATAAQFDAVENPKQGKTIADYKEILNKCFKEAYRLLKPGRWMTVEFSNTQASIWNVIQTTLQEVGFVVANVSALDKQKGSFKAITTTTAVKQDLVISAYKPNGGLEDRFAKRGETEEGAWDFVRAHLKNLPVMKARGGQMEFIAERDPRILYDRMVAFYVGHTTPVPLSSAEFQAGLAEKLPERDGMFFLPEQVNEYDTKRQQMEGAGQLSIFVEDEKSAVAWLRNFLNARPSVYQDIQPEFMQQLSASWKKWEARPELRALLEQNFLRFDGGEVPSQIHSYLSTQFKELRNLAKDDRKLRYKATDRWYVPDPKKNIDVETMRNKRLLEQFWSYLPEGYVPPARNPDGIEVLPGLNVSRTKIPKGKKLKELRTEAVRVGFKHCYQRKDYQTIIVVADMLPESVINEDENLQMIYDIAVTRTEEG
jgi:DNA modification methylase